MPPAKKSSKERLDRLLVDRGLAESREQAQALIMAGAVRVDNHPAPKPGTPVRVDVSIALRERMRYAGRGGLKLEAALDAFAIPVAGRVALDVGASTGGFTDCLLQHGARRVYAVDVGYGQLDYRLRRDSRVVVKDRTNARNRFPLPERVDLVTVDVSFISLVLVLPSAIAHLADGGYALVLVKPQFEAGRSQVGRGGVVRDPRVHARCVGKVVLWAVQHGLRVRGVMPSPVAGDRGNREFFLLLRA